MAVNNINEFVSHQNYFGISICYKGFLSDFIKNKMFNKIFII